MGRAVGVIGFTLLVANEKIAEENIVYMQVVKLLFSV